MAATSREARGILAAIVAESSAESLRVVCPFCDGGRDSEESLVITRRAEGVFFCCHRASCGARGVLNPTGPRIKPNGTVAAKQQQYDGPFHRMHEQHPQWPRIARAPFYGGASLKRCSAYGLYAWGPQEVWKLRGTYGEMIGVQTRGVRPGTGKKAVKSYKHTDGPLYNYFPWATHDPLWIVEDSLSAAVLNSWGKPSVALLGTYLSPGLVERLESGHLCHDGYIVALDPGAEDAAHRIVVALRGQTAHNVRPIYLAQDIKDMENHHLQEFLERVGA